MIVLISISMKDNRQLQGFDLLKGIQSTVHRILMHAHAQFNCAGHSTAVSPSIHDHGIARAQLQPQTQYNDHGLVLVKLSPSSDTSLTTWACTSETKFGGAFEFRPDGASPSSAAVAAEEAVDW